MDPKKIYQKTEKGEDELRTRKYNIPQNLRQVLIFVDGKSNIAKVLEKAAGFPNVGLSLEELAVQGFIQLDETITFAGIKDELIATARQTLGADAEKVIAKIKDAPETKEGLQSTMDNCKKYWAPGNCDFLKPSQKREDVIDMQLKKQGFDPAKVKAVITSHTHLDHTGNIALFPNAIHVFQRKELYQGWWPEKFQGRTSPGTFVMGDLSAAREFNYLELDGDYDLFGDGSVLVLSTPGHTLGHQSVKAKLASGKTIIMSQDAIWMQENLDGYPAGLNYSVKDYTNSLNRLKFMRDLEGTDLFMAHDQDQYAAKGGRWYK